MRVLSSAQRRGVSHIVHIADLHVRIGSAAAARVEEYDRVFHRFLDEIAALPAVRDGTALCAISGDVFHNKGRLDSVAGQRFFLWLNRLLGLLPVVVICGNHDFRQEDPAFTDMIELMVAPYEGRQQPIFYLRETGTYQWENLCIGVVRIQDTLRAFNTAGIVEDLPAFPRPDAAAGCRVAMFHGTISQSALPSGRAAETVAKGYPLAWFQGYDVLLLGDNHRQQVHVDDGLGLAWGYPGSLVQQDFGEPLLGHGYLLWDVEARRAEARHIPNPYGALTILPGPADAARWMVSFGPRVAPRPLAEAKAEAAMPEHPRVRLIGAAHERIEALRALADAGIRPSYVKEAQRAPTGPAGAGAATGPTEDGGRAAAAAESLADLNSPIEWESYVSKAGAGTVDAKTRAWIHDPEGMLVPVALPGLPADIRATIANRNHKMRPLLDTYREESNRASRQVHRVVLSYMEWENLMCYADGNWFDFDRIDGKVALLNGTNASGKSAILDVLFLALFGEPTPSRREFSGSSMSAKVLYDHRAPGASCYALLRLEVDGAPYEIMRSFRTHLDVEGAREKEIDTVQQLVCVVGRVDADQGIVEVVAEGATMVGAWVARHVGTADEMLMGSVLCQHDHHNFFFQKAADQRTLLERALHMETITAFESVLGEAVKAHKYVLGELASYHRGMAALGEGPAADPQGLEAARAELAGLEEGLAAVEAEARELAAAAGSDEGAWSEEGDLDALEAELGALGGALGARAAREAVQRRGVLDSQKADLDARRPPEGPWPEDTLDAIDAAADAHRGAEPAHPRMTMEEADAIRKGYAAWKETADADLLQCAPRAHVMAEEAQRALAGAVRALDRLHASWPAETPATGPPPGPPKALEAWKRDVDRAQAALVGHISKMPACGRSLDSCKEAIAAYDAWKAGWEAEDPKEELEKALAAAAEARAEVGACDGVPVLPFPGGTPKRIAPKAGVIAKAVAKAHRLQGDIARLEASMPVPGRPVGDPKARAAWEEQAAGWAALVGRVPSASAAELRARAERATVRAEIADIEAIEFNPRCRACQKQPRYQRLQALRARLSELGGEGDDGSEGGGEDRARVLREVEIPLREVYERRRAAMEAEIAAWEDARRQGEEAARIAAEAARLRDDLARLSCAICDAKAIWMDRLREAEDRAHRMRGVLDEAPRREALREEALHDMERARVFEHWNTRLGVLEAARKEQVVGFATQWAIEEKAAREEVDRREAEAARLRRFVEQHDRWKADVARAREAREAHRAWAAWDMERARLEDAAARLRWKAEMEAWREEDAAHTKGPMARLELAERIARLRKARARRGWIDAQGRMGAMAPAVKAARARVAQLEAADGIQRARAAQSEGIAGGMAEVAERYEALRELQRRFVGERTEDGFKTYMYRERVLPLIEAHVNEFLGAVDTFRLKIRTKGSRFIYMLEDRGNQPTLDHASGYQRFVVSLGMRVALARIGAVGQNVRHLFLDEGFTACDAENLQKTSDLLQDILRMGGYRSIVMMSHLDAIREAAQVWIPVSRADGATHSRMMFGPRRMRLRRIAPAASVPVGPRPRGRPRKTVA